MALPPPRVGVLPNFTEFIHTPTAIGSCEAADARWRGQRGLWRVRPAFCDAAPSTLNADEV